MPIDVKICGLTTLPTLDAALDAGADYVGLVFYAPSPRNISLVRAAPLVDRARGKAKIVALLVDECDLMIKSVEQLIGPSVIQLHGSETPERVAEIRKLTTASIMKAVKVETRDDVVAATQYASVADMVLFDAKPPKLTADDGAEPLPGGNGHRFDWSLLEAHDPSQPWMLSGGLDAENVADAICRTGATAVDVSSGVERAKGEKDEAMIAAFVAAAKAGMKIDRGVRDHVDA